VEADRSRLARELHESLLNQLALLRKQVDERSASTSFVTAYDQLITSIRDIIAGLRPAMLEYGLHAALKALVEELADDAPASTTIAFTVPSSAARYDPKLERQVYHIVQQLCTNALRHASARTITVGGCLDDGQLELTVEDDGLGFDAGGRLDVNSLLAHKHFGLVGMIERAELAGASLNFKSSPGQGTTARLVWRPSRPLSA